MSRLTAIAAALLLLCACGQTGPLYLPEQEPEERAAEQDEPASPPAGAS